MSSTAADSNLEAIGVVHEDEEQKECDRSKESVEAHCSIQKKWFRGWKIAFPPHVVRMPWCSHYTNAARLSNVRPTSRRSKQAGRLLHATEGTP